MSGLTRAEIDAMVMETLRAERTGATVPHEVAGVRPARRPGASVRSRAIAVWAVFVLVAGVPVGIRLLSSPGGDFFSEAGLPAHPTRYPDGSYEFTRTQPQNGLQPVGYNPCKYIDVEINYVDATPTIRDDVERVTRDLNRVSGLHLRYVGASQRNHLSAPTGRILVSFTRQRNDSSMNDAIAGRGGSSSYANGYPGQTLYYVGGTVTLNADTYNTATRDQQLLVLAHEFGHAVGLNHAPGPELMNANPWSYHLHHWAHGDLTGLARLGALPCR